MPRLPRMLIKDADVVYHVISRTALDGYVIEAVEKEYLMNLIRWLSGVFFVEVFGFCIMGNHFHLLCSMRPSEEFDEGEVLDRVRNYYQKDDISLSSEEMDYWRERLSDLSRYVQEIKQRFSRWYNKRKGRKGYFWGGRFKSVVLERDEALLNCLAYIDLNPVRAGLVTRPEEYRWCSLGYHLGTGNKGYFLSTDFGVKTYSNKGYKERLKRYMEYVYEKGGIIDNSEAATLQIFKDVKGGLADKKKLEIKTSDVFKYRIRYFTDGLIIGSKEFVENVAWKARDLLNYRGQKRLKHLSSMGYLYSFRTLT